MDCQRILERFKVTEEQVDAVTRVIDDKNGSAFYVVQSASDPAKQYTVRWCSQSSRLGCSCPAGMNGIVCWHMRAAAAHDAEYTLAETARLEAEARAERERLDAICPYRWPATQVEHDAQRFTPRPFSLLR